MSEQPDTMSLKIIVTGPFSSGKTEFIRAVSETKVISVDVPQNPKSIVLAMDYGHIKADRDTTIILLGTSSGRRFSFDGPITKKFLLGYVIMVDSAYPGTFREAKSMIEAFKVLVREPYVVAANKQDKDGAWPVDDLRIALRIPSEIPIVPCIVTDKESVKLVLVTLLDEVLKRMAADKQDV